MNNEKDAAKAPEVTVWQWGTEMPGTAHERKSYYGTLRDGEKETRFILRVHADGTIVAEPYVVHEYDYDDIDSDEDEEEDEEFYYDDEEEEDDGGEELDGDSEGE